MKIFTMVFAVAYLVAYQGGIAPFRYYPVLRRFSTEELPLSTSGPAMLWYAWMAVAAVAALALALVIPRRVADRVPPALAWMVPVAAIVLVFIHERGWFL